MPLSPTLSGNSPTFSQGCRLHVPINQGFVVQPVGKVTWSLIGKGGCWARDPCNILMSERWVIIYLFKHIIETVTWHWPFCLQYRHIRLQTRCFIGNLISHCTGLVINIQYRFELLYVNKHLSACFLSPIHRILMCIFTGNLSSFYILNG